MKEKVDEAIEIGVKRGDLNQKSLIKLSNMINKDLEKFSKEIGVAVQSKPVLTEWEEAQSFINRNRKW